MAHDPVNHPQHYTSHPSGVECIQITEHMGFNLGNAVKYIWRADLKDDAIEDLKKARWYIERELARRGQKTTQEAGDGWQAWTGGKCPVREHELVDVCFRVGKRKCVLANDLAWHHDNNPDDIVAYRLAK